VLERLKRSDMFLTSKGSYIDVKEWHTVVSSGAAMALSPPLWIIFTLKLVVDEKRRAGSFAEYRQEVPYWLGTGLAVGLSSGFSGRLGTSVISWALTLAQLGV